MHCRFALWCAAIAITGCVPEYGFVDLVVISSPPVAPTITSERIEISLGISVAVRVEPQSTKAEPYGGYERIALTAQDGDVLGVLPGPGPREFILSGLALGETCVQVTVDGHSEECIPAEVQEQR